MALRPFGCAAVPVPAAGRLDVDRRLDYAVLHVARAMGSWAGERAVLQSWLKHGINPAALQWIREEYHAQPVFDAVPGGSGRKRKCMLIRVKLPKDRRQIGELAVLDVDALVLHGIECRGKADNGTATARGNPSRTTTMPYGDTPSGRWHGCQVTKLPQPADGIGGAWIPLEKPWSGDAVQAQINGRRGLAIHAGRGNDALMATKGCIRVRDRDFARLCEVLGDKIFDVEVIDTEPAVPGREGE